MLNICLDSVITFKKKKFEHIGELVLGMSVLLVNYLVSFISICVLGLFNDGYS